MTGVLSQPTLSELPKNLKAGSIASMEQTQSLAILRHMALNLIKQEKTTKGGIKAAPNFNGS